MLGSFRVGQMCCYCSAAYRVGSIFSWNIDWGLKEVFLFSKRPYLPPFGGFSWMGVRYR